MKRIPTAICRKAGQLLFAALLISLSSLAITAQAQVSAVNAASFATDKVVTPDTIAAAFGTFTTQNNQVFIASTVPLPTTLGGVRVRIGTTDCGLFFVAPSQINFVLPASVADGNSVTVTVTNSNNSTTTGTITVVRAAPGIFSARSNGQGAAAAQTTTGGPLVNTYNPDGTERDVSAGTIAQPNVLVLYVTGIRNTPAANPTDGNGVAEAVTCTIQGVPATVLYAGQAPGFVGLDQVNVVIPPELAGLGSVNIKLRANNRDSNVVTIKLAGSLPPVRAQAITFGQTVTGALAADDQVQAGSAGSTYFFDAYSFTTTAANTTIAIDLRSTSFDAAVLLYNNANGLLTPIAADDQSGNYGSTQAANNNNALLMTVIPNPGNYAIFATSSDLEPNGLGSYTLKLLNNVATPIAYGQTLNGSIANTDLQTSAGTYLDLYWFTGAQGDNTRTNMNSTAFDSFLLLHSNVGDPRLAQDDNSGGGQNAQLTFRLTSNGIHLIIATPLDPNITGNYSVQLQKLASVADDPQAALKASFDSLFKAPGREIRDFRFGLVDPDKPSLERFGIRRIIER